MRILIVLAVVFCVFPVVAGESGTLTAGRLSSAEAREIALGRVGGGEVVKVERDYDDGITVYEVDIIKDGMKYEVEIDAATGGVREFEAKRFGGAKRWDDDHWDDD